jgi:hypothetical protein
VSRRLLMIESWVNSNGIIMPEKIRALGHRYVLLSRAPEHYSRHSPIAGGHPVLNLAEAVVTVETNDLAALLECAGRLHAREAFAGVITSCDYYLLAVAHVARELGLPGPSPEAMAVAVRKDLVREACRRAGIASPLFKVAARIGDVTQFAAEVGYPVVVKPVDLTASEKVALVRDDAEAARAFDEVMAGEVILRLAGERDLGASYGLFLTVGGVVATLGNTAAGNLYDGGPRYLSWSFLAALGLAAATGVALLERRGALGQPLPTNAVGEADAPVA